MTIDEVRKALKDDPLFAWRGAPDVSLIPATRQTLIECEGTEYIDRAYFQFQNEKLFIMILMLDPHEVSYYDTYVHLVRKYGEPTYLDPSTVVWESERLRLSLEKPLSVKYVDAAAYAALGSPGGAGRDYQTLSREQFLGEL